MLGALKGVRDVPIRRWAVCIVWCDYSDRTGNSLLKYGEKVWVDWLHKRDLVEALRRVGNPNSEAGLKGKPQRRELLRIKGTMTKIALPTSSLRFPESGTA